jgi:hypothetical protein
MATPLQTLVLLVLLVLLLLLVLPVLLVRTSLRAPPSFPLPSML